MTYTSNSEPPEIYHKWVGLSVIAAALQRKCILEWDASVYPNLFVVLVGPSGARKGTAMAPGYNLLRRIGIPMCAEAITREAFLRDLAATVTTDSGGIQHCSLTVFSKELTVFITGANSVQLLSDLNDLYDCGDEWTNRTKTAGTDKIMGVWLNLIGATTPALIQSVFPRDAIGGGFVSRTLFIYADRLRKPVALPRKTDRDKELEKLLFEDLAAINTIYGEFQPNEEFLTTWEGWYTNQFHNPPFVDDRLEGYPARRAKHILKLCMLLSASRSGNRVIELPDFQRACGLITEAEHYMTRAFTGVGQNRLAAITDRVLEFIVHKGEASGKEILNRFSHDVNQNDLAEIMLMLKERGLIDRITTADKTLFKAKKGALI